MQIHGRYIIALPFFILLALSNEARAEKWNDAYSFRDYRLGMTLSEFKNTPFPDKTEKDIQIRCSNEREKYGITIPTPSREGTVECQLYGLLYKAWDVHAGCVLLGDACVDPAFIFIKREQDADYILSMIEIFVNPERYDIIKAGLTRKYGSSPSIQRSARQNGFGAIFNDEKVEWKSKTSHILLWKYGGGADESYLTYWLTPLMNYWQKKEDTENGNSKDRF